ncbi:UDP-N-acetylglucosamine 2-epimerase [Shewanella sp. D64]|uniref:UDP-N-acetylglucosamine 2-epimerase n=1 Tax=unclassified Shewanella TaxID=196818 RepID=UPI0022BA7008|nr:MULTISPECIES: UDP-N-acetylglucosamine 2-epimerase [unclassified Shewanella]MEC4726560.1 UDP-N-acetylglucosamine 2-epimerase [Shewanella sp. D64]MEC4737399.1 UDP-N-acetylglucosamine 2-epimerase [Shewanella sp. E94]WBJ97218.1 UDP-N-acetylglucosamine 2-epimerase [Shewanella sp. MTB7]
MPKKIAVFTGTRADYGLLYWLISDIQTSKELTLQLIVSGSHLSPEFGNTFEQIEKDGFYIDEKIEMLLSSDSAVGTAKSMGLGIIGYSEALDKLKPDVLVILGDRFEALAVAQTATILGIAILHIHGGEITEGAYDDAIRHAITKLSQIHCTSTETYRQRVIQMGEHPCRVHNVGAIGLDHINRSQLMSLEALSTSLDYSLTKPYFVVTYHPVTLSKEPAQETFSALLDALTQFPSHQVILTYPNADNGGRGLISQLQAYAAQSNGRVLAIPSLGQTRYLSAVKHAAAVIGNSSSGVIEVPAFNVATVDIGDRQKGRLAASSVINTKPIFNAIVNAITQAIDMTEELKVSPVSNPYGQGLASHDIRNILVSMDTDPIKTFYDIEVGQ